MRKAFLKQAKRFPWITNVSLFGCLFAGGDFVHQWFSRRDEMDWRQTGKVAVVAFSFHGNFNYFWMRGLERRFPGNSASMVLRKVILDQTISSPIATSAFYTGMSLLDGKDDIFQDCRGKFLNTYKTGLMYWPFVQHVMGLPNGFRYRLSPSLDYFDFGLSHWSAKLLNFTLVPVYLRTTFTGCCAFVWAIFLCFSRQSGDGTATAALTWILDLKKRLLLPDCEKSTGIEPTQRETGNDTGHSEGKKP